MRTIKFRGLRIGLEGFSYSLPYYLEGFAYGLPYYNEMYDEWGIGDYAVDEDTIDQFTGLYDKNGNEIYENDILQVKIDGKEYNPFLVVYSEVYAGFCMLSENVLNNVIYKPHRPINPNWWDEIKDEIEIIGNIYDNPELFKQ